jgi:uncharacterized membrane protein
MKDFFASIQNLFENFLFAPFNALQAIELENWWFANIITWVFVVIFLVSFTYWMLQLKTFNANNEEDKSISSHSYL